MVAAASPSLFRNTVQEAAQDGKLLMGKWVAAARTALQSREAACRDLRERDAISLAAIQLKTWEGELCKHYPMALLEAFTRSSAGKSGGARSLTDVSFDELELMDEMAVQSSVALGRVQQMTLHAVEASLPELNTLMCGLQGLSTVSSERNPLQPQAYLQALHVVIEQSAVPPPVQLQWINAMATVVGPELRARYAAYCKHLRERGVSAAGFSVSTGVANASAGVGRGVAQQAAAGTSAGASGAEPAPTQPRVAQAAVQASAPRFMDSGLLTLDKLRGLLTGDLANSPPPRSTKEQFADQFARRFEEPAGDSTPPDFPASDFDATVPAALEALKEMAQVQVVVQRLENRRKQATPKRTAEKDDPVESMRMWLRERADSTAQLLGLEVVTLMVENIAKDPRLLQTVQRLVRCLEPALLQLSLSDPRLFSDKSHPARQLLMEITQRSLAYTSEKAPGFNDYLTAVDHALEPIRSASEMDDGVFQDALNILRTQWSRITKNAAPRQEAAAKALAHAEQRNLLAQKIAKDIARHPDAQKVPAVVVSFLCSVWALVIAQSRLESRTPDANERIERYQSLVAAMLWSAHPELARQNVGKLTRTIPRLLATLREGLATIGYPPDKTNAFLEELMALHEQAFRAAQKDQAGADAPHPAKQVPMLSDDEPWMAPAEAQASNFIELHDVQSNAPSTPATAAGASSHNTAAAPSGGAVWRDDLQHPMGSWFELLIDGQWQRTQLTWTSPHNTMFLFTTSGGVTQSMTQRTRDKLMAAGQLRVVADQSVVDGALDAVAQTAMRNSVNMA